MCEVLAESISAEDTDSNHFMSKSAFAAGLERPLFYRVQCFNSGIGDFQEQARFIKVNSTAEGSWLQGQPALGHPVFSVADGRHSLGGVVPAGTGAPACCLPSLPVEVTTELRKGTE